MIENQEVKVYSFGFIYNNIYFCWYKKDLYRMPYERNHRYYNKRKLNQNKQGNSIGYSIDGDFKSMKTLKQITTEINYSENIVTESVFPF